jgi:hypothetical protein
MARIVRRPLKIMEFNVNGIERQAYVVRKQLQGLKTDVALFSVTYLKLMRFYIPNYHIYRADRQYRHKEETVVAVKRGIPHIQSNLPTHPISLEATWV